jgi:hypothetical protein
MTTPVGKLVLVVCNRFGPHQARTTMSNAFNSVISDIGQLIERANRVFVSVNLAHNRLEMT